jgi:hypothetical protein
MIAIMARTLNYDKVFISSNAYNKGLALSTLGDMKGVIECYDAANKLKLV